ncbi:MAG: anthranilate phosphoribosyltransferase [Candidatus Eremiobacteraeota bacterium]|nr:anthranilate phosphoribosyltransferase [Candidatus Eremiobacteraeota bacterium]NNM93667.1 anthranilate phosphoribosyltransferase [Candidatus Eremiobacteraeota bacterium]
MNEDAARRLRRLIAGNSLDRAESAAFIGELMDGAIEEVAAAGALVALAMRGESVEEIVGAAEAMRARMVELPHDAADLVDIVGTGGDGAGTINLSTMAALVLAAAGVPVAKHGNRAASSSCGSADVLEACGYRLDLSPERSAELLRDTGFAFLFAPRYHPAMRNVANVRRTLGVRTILNVLGPLCNPARAPLALVGVARDDLVEPIGEVMRALGVRAGGVLCGEGGVDEAVGMGVTHLYRFDEAQAWHERIDPAALGIAVPLSDLVERSVEDAARAFRDILGGRRSGRSEVVALNAAIALFVIGRASSMEIALARSREILASGAALALFERAAEASRA